MPGTSSTPLVLQLGEHPLAGLLHPALEGDDLGPRHVEGGQDPRDVLGERLALHHHCHLLGAEDVGVLEVQVGRAVQGDGGLAGARAPLEDHDAAVRRGDELELLRVDEGGDLLEVLVLAERLVVDHAEAARLKGHRGLMGRGRANGHSGSALQGGHALVGEAQPSVAAPDERAGGPGDPAELAVDDAHRAAGLDHPLHRAPPEVLVVVVALFVAVVDARDGGVAPVDDVDRAARLDETAVADQHVAAALAVVELEVTEVRTGHVDGEVLALAVGRPQRLHAVHLGDERGHVLESGLRDLIAEGQQVGVVFGVGGSLELVLGELLLDLPEDRQLLLEDLGLRRVGSKNRQVGFGPAHPSASSRRLSSRRRRACAARRSSPSRRARQVSCTRKGSSTRPPFSSW